MNTRRQYIATTPELALHGGDEPGPDLSVKKKSLYSCSKSTCLLSPAIFKVGPILLGETKWVLKNYDKESEFKFKNCEGL
jgi:hypothetical protein